MKSAKRSAFSLIELVIVIVILAVISAIALPRISRGAKGADESALGQDLAVMRSAIELYSAEHGGTFPGANTDADGGAAGSFDAFKSQLLRFTDKDGGAADAKDATHIYGPYLHRIPPLPVGTNAGKDTVKMGNTGPTVSVADGDGWVYNYDSGKIIANADDNDESGNLTYDAW